MGQTSHGGHIEGVELTFHTFPFVGFDHFLLWLNRPTYGPCKHQQTSSQFQPPLRIFPTLVGILFLGFPYLTLLSCSLWSSRSWFSWVVFGSLPGSLRTISVLSWHFLLDLVPKCQALSISHCYPGISIFALSRSFRVMSIPGCLGCHMGNFLDYYFEGIGSSIVLPF